MLRSRRTAAALTAMFLGTTAVAAGCGQDGAGSGTGTSAGSGDALTVYSGRNAEFVEPLLDIYREQTGHDVEVRYGESAQMASTIVEEGENSPADVFFSQDAGALGAVDDEDLLERLPGSELDAVEPRYRADDGDWVGTSARARIIAFSTDRLTAEEVPGSVFDLTAPEWEGRIGWAPTNASLQAFLTAMRILDGDDAAEDWLRGMIANDTQVYADNIAVRDAIAAGDIDLGLINHYYVAQAYAEQGPDYPVGIKHPLGKDPGALINVAGAAVLSSSDQAEEAEQFIAFLLSKPAQRYFADQTKEYPLIGGVDADSALDPLSSLDSPKIDLSNLDDLRGTLALMQETGAL